MKTKKIKKYILIEASSEKKLISFLNVLEAVGEDMGLKITDGAMDHLLGSDY